MPGEHGSEDISPFASAAPSLAHWQTGSIQVVQYQNYNNNNTVDQLFGSSSKFQFVYVYNQCCPVEILVASAPAKCQTVASASGWWRKQQERVFVQNRDRVLCLFTFSGSRKLCGIVCSPPLEWARVTPLTSLTTPGRALPHSALQAYSGSRAVASTVCSFPTTSITTRRPSESKLPVTKTCTDLC